VGRIVELSRRGKSQAPPPWVVWEALCDPWRDEDREWFDACPGEVAPTILDRERPRLVVWSSIWADRAEFRIRFDLEADGGGSFVTWTLFGPDDIEEDDVRHRRYRLNQLINGHLRDAFDQ